MKYYEEFKIAFPVVDSVRNESILNLFINETGLDFDDAISDDVLIKFFDWIVKEDYSHFIIRRSYRTAKLYTQFVNKKLGKNFKTEGLVNVALIYRQTELPYLFFDDMFNDIEDEIELWINNKDIDNSDLLEDYFYEFKAIVSLLWFGFQFKYLPEINRNDIDLENHTVCGIYIYNLNAWNSIKDLYYLDSYHSEQFGNVVENKYIDNGFLFRHKTKPNVLSSSISYRRIQNNMQLIYDKLDIPRLSANEITLLGFMSRFVKTEKGLDSLFDNRDVFYNYIVDNIKTIDSAGTVYNKKSTYERLDIYRTKLLKYLIKSVDIESKL